MLLEQTTHMLISISMAWGGRRGVPIQQVPSQSVRWKHVGDTFEEMLCCTNQQQVVGIANLSVGMPKSSVAGIIIQKGQLKQFISKKDNMQKCVIDITIRDSPQDSINISCWGHMQFVEFIDAFHVGDIVVIDNAMVQPKPPDGSHERFKPFTTSPLFLNLYESRGTIKASKDNYDFYQDLLKLPIKAQNNCYTIFDLNSHGTDLQGQHISVLAVVKQIWEPTIVTTKSGKELKKREVKLFDDTAPDLSFTIWNGEWIYQSSQWVPKNSIIHASDVKVSYDNFQKRIVIMATDRTVITLQPKMREAYLLARFAETVDFDQMLFYDNNWEIELDPFSLECIKEEMCVRDVKVIRDRPGDEMYCILWAVLTYFNIDDPSSAIISHMCSCCHKPMPKVGNLCGCSKFGSDQRLLPQDHIVPFYNLKVSLTDETGTIDNCILSTTVAEKMMGETADKFGALNEQAREHLKWKHVLERYKAVIQLIQSTHADGKRKVRVLSLEMLQSDHLFEKFVSYQKSHKT